MNEGDHSDEGVSQEGGDTAAAGPLSRRGFVQAGAATGLGALALGSAGSASAQTVAEEDCGGEFASIEVNQDFVMLNNDWGNESAEQCIYLYDDGTFGWTFSGGGGGINFPQVYSGTRPWGSNTNSPPFPVPRGQVDEFWLEWDVDIDVDGGWNLMHEWWLTTTQPNPDIGDDELTHEIMMVCDWGGGHGHGGVLEEDVWRDEYGNQIDYWAFYPNGGGADADFHIFRINGGASTGGVDFTEIVDFLGSDRYYEIIEREGLQEVYPLQDDMLVTGVEFGTETFDGPTGEIHFQGMEYGIDGNHYVATPVDGETTTPQTPASPDDAWESAVGETWIDLEWTAVDGADGYVVTVAGDETDTSDTSIRVDGLEPGTSYDVSVAAYNDAGESSEVTTTVTTDGQEDDGENGGEDDGQNGGEDDETQPAAPCEGDFDGDGEVTTADVSEFQSQLFSDEVQNDPDCYSYAGGDTVSHGDVIALFQDATGL